MDKKVGEKAVEEAAAACGESGPSDVDAATVAVAVLEIEPGKVLGLSGIGQPQRGNSTTGKQSDKVTYGSYNAVNYGGNRRRNGSVPYKSFIPPMPKDDCPYATSANYTGAIEKEGDDEDETRAKELEARAKMSVAQQLRVTKYYHQISEPSLSTPFQADYIGVLATSEILLRFQDPVTVGGLSRLEDALRTYFKPEDPSKKNIIMPIEEVDRGRIVIAQVGETRYVRARVMDVDREALTVTVKAVDYWEKHRIIPHEKVFYIIPMFMTAAFGVQVCNIRGLELFYHTGVINEIANLMPAFDKNVKVEEYALDLGLECSVPVVTFHVLKYPSFKTSYRDILLERLGRFTRVPRGFFMGQILEGTHLTSINKDLKEVWISLHSKVAAKLALFGPNPSNQQLDDEIIARNVERFEELFFKKQRKRFLAKYMRENDTSYYRVEVMEANKETQKAKVQYLEYGTIWTIPWTDILPTELVDPSGTIDRIPMQAFAGYLNGIDSFLDADSFFNHIGVSTPQKFVVSGFRKYMMPYLDMYAKIDKENPNRWVFVNQFVLDEGIAVGPGVKKPMPYNTIDAPTTTDEANKPDAKQAAKSKRRQRYLLSCRFEKSED